MSTRAARPPPAAVAALRPRTAARPPSRIDDVRWSATGGRLPRSTREMAVRFPVPNRKVVRSLGVTRHRIRLMKEKPPQKREKVQNSADVRYLLQIPMVRIVATPDPCRKISKAHSARYRSSGRERQEAGTAGRGVRPARTSAASQAVSCLLSLCDRSACKPVGYTGTSIGYLRPWYVSTRAVCPPWIV
jgi:hypothetical protein